MDRAPYLMDGGRWGYRMGPAEIHDSLLRDGLDDAFSGKHSGWHTEDLVTQAQLTRAAQDRFAERSQQRFSAAVCDERSPQWALRCPPADEKTTRATTGHLRRGVPI
jgi:acetyl-CoA acetyltransferase